MDVWLIRHGATAANLERRYLGRGDEPLSAAGERQLQGRSACTEARRVFVSPRRRAQQTARILFPRAELSLLDDLREMDFGVFEGRTAAELCGDAAYQAWLDSGCMAPCPGGEGIEIFGERVCAAFAQAVRECMAAGEARLIVVAHGGSLMAVMSRYACPERPYFDWHVPPGGGWRARLDESQQKENCRLDEQQREEIIRLVDYAPLEELCP